MDNISPELLNVNMIQYITTLTFYEVVMIGLKAAILVSIPTAAYFLSRNVSNLLNKIGK